MSNSVRPQRWKPIRLPRPWDSPGKNTEVGCHFLLQWMKVKNEREVAQSCPTLSDPMDYSLPGSSIPWDFPGKSTGVGCHCLLCFTTGWPVFPVPLVKEIVFNPLYILASFVKDKVCIGAWVYLWAFYFVPLIYISVFVPVPYCLHDCGFVVEPEVGQVDSSSSILLSQDCFGYSRFFCSSTQIVKFFVLALWKIPLVAW